MTCQAEVLDQPLASCFIWWRARWRASYVGEASRSGHVGPGADVGAAGWSVSAWRGSRVGAIPGTTGGWAIPMRQEEA